MKLNGLDLLRGVAAFCIVGHHLNLIGTPAANASRYFCDTSVGVFGAVSGLLLAVSLDKHPQGMIGKKARRLLPIYFFWTAVYLGMTCLFDLLLDGGKINPRYYDLSFWCSAIFQGFASAHLWYVIDLFYISVFFTLINRWMKQWWMWGVMSIVGLAACVLVDNNFGYYPCRLLSFMALGMMVGRMEDAQRKGLSGLRVALPWLIIALALHICLGVNGFIRDWLLVLPLLLVFARNDFPETAIGHGMGEQSLGIYLMHPLIAAFFGLFIRRTMSGPHGLLTVLVDWVLIYALSYGVTFQLRRSRWTKWSVA